MSSNEGRGDERPLTRLAAFARLRTGARGAMPLVTQVTTSDCGAACLAMVLGLHGRSLSLAEVRAALGGAVQAVTARQIAEAARHFGLRARGVKLAPEQLRYLPRGSIMHWEMNHFVVFEALDRRGVRIVDPSSGPRRMSFADVAERYTGIALLFEPGPSFAIQTRRASLRWGRYRRWLQAAPGYWPRVLALSVVLQLVALAAPAITGLVVDSVVPRHDGRLLQLMAAGGLAVLTLQFLANYLRSSLLLHLRTYIEARMTSDLNEHVLRLPFAFFQQRAGGDLLMRLASSAQLRELLTSAALSLVIDGSMASIYFVLLWLLAPPLAACACGIALAHVVAVAWNGRRNAELTAEQLIAQARLSSAQVEALAAIEPIKALGAEMRIAERWAELYVEVLNRTLERGQLNNQVAAISGGLGFAGPLMLLLVGAQRVLSGELGIGAMLALSSLGSAFLTPIGSLVSMWTQLQTMSSHLARLEDILDSPAEPERTAASGSWPTLSGHIELRGVSFSYGPLSPRVLDGIQLDIRPGEFVAIVGRSGSGKSTLARLLTGLYAPSAGSILFEGQDVQCWDPRTLRSMLGMVTQDTRLFAASVRDNITLFDNQFTIDRVQAVAMQAELHEDISKLPLGYDTVLSDGGGSLSGGQRQRLSLARSLLREPKVMVLDEATSQLDTVSERLVQRQLAALHCTRIVIAHRLSTIRDAERIVVLEAGRIVGEGRHAELVVKCRAYRELIGSRIDELA